MNSEELYKQITLLVNDYHEISISNPINREGLLQAIRENLNADVTELFVKGKNENYYWEHCTFFTYQNKYQERLEEYLHNNDNEEFHELEFINSEKLNIQHYAKDHYLTFVNTDTINNISKSRLRKLRFLQDKKDNLLVDNSTDLDLSNSSGALKVIYLERLGIIDYLSKKYPFNTSINKLAEVLSGVTGEKVTTLQSYLNPILSPGVDKTKSPLSNKKNVSLVNNQLNRIGFELE